MLTTKKTLRNFKLKIQFTRSGIRLQNMAVDKRENAKLKIAHVLVFKLNIVWEDENIFEVKKLTVDRIYVSNYEDFNVHTQEYR